MTNVGKTSIVTKFAENKFSEKLGATVKIDTVKKNVEILDEETGDLREVNFVLWDTAG